MTPETSTIYTTGIMTVQHVRKWYHEFQSRVINISNKYRTRQHTTSASYADDLGSAKMENSQKTSKQL